MSIQESNYGVDIQYMDRIRHVFSAFRTNDEELAYAESITDEAETIEIITDESHETQVIVSTAQSVLHFRTFRTDYIGHASRTLVALLEHFRVRLPIEFIVTNHDMIIYLTGNKVVVGNSEYPIEVRDDVYELVEPVTWMISSTILDVIMRLADEYQISHEEVVESAIRLIGETQPPMNEDVISDTDALVGSGSS
ncbi:hypothetical protein LLE49_04425 [Alicyclobacillus tolerans]|uniref:hypothetical protein n=1 Tax=Alicyclobacillus tolerans TaxID=90970 RepID=UPI001F2212C5|nr:hypothetical protein [Alicyclobacillus tolerans]MCF8563981.1 hypothetical protein [Alicyclobacillus tolerans]